MYRYISMYMYIYICSFANSQSCHPSGLVSLGVVASILVIQFERRATMTGLLPLYLRAGETLRKQRTDGWSEGAAWSPKKRGWNGRCLSPDSCRWWSDPLFQERSGDSRSVVQEGHDLGRSDEIPDLCLVGVGWWSAVAAMEKMWGIEVSRACDAAGFFWRG